MSIRIARSRDEARCFVRLLSCEQCGGARLPDSDPFPESTADRLVLTSTCGKCGHAMRHEFSLRADVREDEASQLIDVGQWLVLYQLTEVEASGTQDARRARALRLEGAAFLDEALKFFEEGNDLPPEQAFFSDASLARFRDAPQQFARQRIVQLKARLPKRT